MENTPRSSTRQSRGFTQRLKEDGRQTLDQRKRSAAERVDEIAQAIGRTGEQFSGNEPTLADLANRLAGTVSNFATRLREGSLEDLVEDTRSLARRNPGLFIAGGVLAGFALARFAKASAQRTESSTLSHDAPVLNEEAEATVIVTETVAPATPAGVSPATPGGV
ncbi:MAG TPA: hypothetical protein VFO35_18380 [Steroidobacteraceae bacterium]|nr:hypothetical protein [Steroidobacteraceae bacterium]